MKLSKIAAVTSAVALAIASASISASVFDDDYYEDDQPLNAVDVHVPMKIHGDHYEKMIQHAKMQTNVPITPDDAHDFDNDEYNDA